MKKPLRLLRRLVAIVLAIAALAIATVFLSSRPYRYYEADRVPKRPVAIVFGAFVAPYGVLSPMRRDRVDGAIELYRKGTVSRLLMSGDNSRKDYDEVTAMKDYAVSKGVASSDIILDHAGFSTYESCYRAKAVFGVQSAVAITQRYHLPRATYSCRKLGIDAVGYGVADFSRYPDRTAQYALRELGADLKAVWEVNIARPLPTFLGSAEQKP